MAQAGEIRRITERNAAGVTETRATIAQLKSQAQTLETAAACGLALQPRRANAIPITGRRRQQQAVVPQRVVAAPDEAAQVGQRFAVDKKLEIAQELLKQLAREIYQISSAQHDDAPGGLKPPLDVLRQFIRSGYRLVDTETRERSMPGPGT